MQRQPIILLIFIQAALVLSILFNISPVRILLGFAFITVIPGIVIVKLVLPKAEKIEQIIFSVGISLIFFICVGLFTNQIGYQLGIMKPLDTIPLLVTSSVLIDCLALYVFRGSENRAAFSVFAIENIKRKRNLVLLFLCLLPVLSIIGAIMASIPPHSNNILLLLMIVIVSAVVLLITVYNELPSKIYLAILFVVSLALIFHFAFYSNNIVGGDIFSEYYAFGSTLQHSYWNIQTLGKLNAMLSVTILPTVYSAITGVNGTWIFKIMYTSIFAIVPIGLYQLFEKHVDKKIAFLAVFFFMSNYVFFWEILELPRQMIAELFFVSLFLTIFNKTLREDYKILLFIFFSFGLIVSHYAVAYVFLAFIFSFWLFNIVRKKQSSISINMIMIFAATLFGWYIYTSLGSTFGDLLDVLQRVSQNFWSDFFVPQSRSSTVLAGLGAAPEIGRTFLQSVGQYVFILSEFLIVAGLFLSVFKYKRNFFKNHFNVFSVFSLMLLGVVIIVPHLAGSFNMERFYHLSLFFLAPFCILGGIYILSIVSRHRINVKFLSLVVVLLVLIPVFLFQSGFIYEVSKQKNLSLPLSSYRIDSVTLAYYGVLDPSAVAGAKWLQQNRNPVTIIYADPVSILPLEYMVVEHTLSLAVGPPLPSGSIIFLTPYILGRLALFSENHNGNMTQIEQAVPSLFESDTIYSSGSCEIRIAY